MYEHNGVSERYNLTAKDVLCVLKSNDFSNTFLEETILINTCV